MIEEFSSESEIEEEELYEHYKFKADPGQVVIRVDKFSSIV